MSRAQTPRPVPPTQGRGAEAARAKALAAKGDLPAWAILGVIALVFTAILVFTLSVTLQAVLI